MTVGDPPDTELPRIGRYQLLEKRGSGGLGTVFAAYDPQLARTVAVKVVKPGQQEDAESSCQRLLREARLAARINHPNVVTVHDSGEVDGDVFIAMELVEGVTLSVWLRLAERRWQAVRDVLVAAGKGLAAAHAQGLVHRDFKPSNVIVGDDGRVRVIDFGLARAGAHTPSARPDAAALAQRADLQVTKTGFLLGTPAYLAPEQVTADAPIGPAVDQFAFCVTMYEALYRERPFKPSTLEELPRIVAAGVPPHERGTGLPRWLHAAVIKGLAPTPGDRHASMSVLLNLLQRDRRSRARRFAGAGVIAAVSVLGTWAAVATHAEPAGLGQSEVDALASEARAAAARASYVYPPLDDPSAITAYGKIRQLEQVGEASATSVASGLRSEFASALVRLGDELWDRDGGQLFATDFYAHALIFEPENERAAARSAMTSAELAGLREQAATGNFNEHELLAGAVLAVVAEPDPTARTRAIEALYARPRPPSVSHTARLECVVGDAERAAIRETLQRRAPRPDGSADPPAAAGAAADARADAREGEPSAANRGAGSTIPANRAEARRVTQLARAAIRAGQWSRAKTQLHDALRHQPRYAPALAGLAEVHFEANQYPKATSFASKAVKAQPKNAGYRLLLGDCYQKVFDYTRAEAQYRAAAKLGSAQGRRRLEQLAARTGSARTD